MRKLLNIELEDLQGDIKDIQNVQTDRLKKGEITNYVFLGNMSFLKREFDSIAKIREYIDQHLSSDEIRQEELVAELEHICRDFTLGLQIPAAVYTVIQKKIDKVLLYMQMDG